MRPDGYIIEVDADGRVRRETDTRRCAHCAAHVEVRAAVGWCPRCAAFICTRCEAHKRCQPFEAQIAQRSGWRPPRSSRHV